ncbi:MAG: histidine kinase [Candidatus Marinimicrobia bacterium]|nr:histidine kinase [Candidatus Neomarinimicrobiota bacterium]
MRLKRKILKSVLVHLFFWLMVFLGLVLFYGQKKDNYLTVLYQLLITMPVYISATYFTIYYIVPRFLLTGQYLKSVIYFIYTSLTAVFLEMVVIIYGMFVLVWPEGSLWGRIRPTYIDAYSLIAGIHFIILLAVAIRVLRLWTESQNRYRLLEQKKIEAELQFLKAQMHPHFLFNTLNNLYALTLKKSDAAPDVVLKISSILDYILYQCNGEWVDLEKEIQLMQDYIDLEKLRCGDRCDVNLVVSGPVNQLRVMPLVFLPFVENAFKHGVANNQNRSWINIHLLAHPKRIEFKIENSLRREQRTGKEGIGLKNVKSRLKVVYKNKFDLFIKNTREVYSVDLILEIEGPNES